MQEALGKARRQLVTLRNQLIAVDVSSEPIFSMSTWNCWKMRSAGRRAGRNSERPKRSPGLAGHHRDPLPDYCALQDPLLAALAADLHYVRYRVLRVLMGIDEQSYALPEKPVVVVARDLSPS